MDGDGRDEAGLASRRRARGRLASGPGTETETHHLSRKFFRGKASAALLLSLSKRSNAHQLPGATWQTRKQRRKRKPSRSPRRSIETDSSPALTSSSGSHHTSS